MPADDRRAAERLVRGEPVPVSAPRHSSWPPAANRRRLRNLLLDARLQLGFSLILVVLCALILAVLGALMYRKARLASQVILDQARATLPGEEVLAEIAAATAAEDRAILVTLVVSGLVLSLLLLAFGVALTHRVVGPLHKMTSAMRKVREGKLAIPHNLRKGDQLGRVYEEFRAMQRALRERALEDSMTIADLLVAAEREGVDAHPALREHFDRLRAMKRERDRALD